MKTSLVLSLFAVALVGAASLFSQSLAQETVRLCIDVDRVVLPAESTERAVVKIGLDCKRMPRRTERQPVNLALVIDRSGSMGGEKIAQAREAALAAVRCLDANDIISIIAFDSTVEIVVPAQRVGRARGLEAAIRGINARGGTALYGGVSSGATELRKHIEDGLGVNRVILLSDGQANEGPSSPEELGRLGHSLMKEGISVTTIGLGLGFNEDLMARLAQRSEGNTYFVENSADLSRIFATELGDVLNVVARRIVIEIEFPAGVRPLNFVGRAGSIRGQHAELTLSQLYGGQEKFALVEVEVSPVAAGAEREIARASVRYEDAITQRTSTITAQRKVQFSTDRKTMISSADHRVQADYAANVLAVAKEKAIVLVDSGRKDEAATLLRQRVQELKKIGEVYSNVAVQASAAAVAPEAERINREGLDNAQRKSYRAESQQVKAQQNKASSRE